jgi:hypothetical protein
MYKLTPNPKWYKMMADLEEGHDISAGVEVGGLLIEQMSFDVEQLEKAQSARDEP